MGAMKPGDEVRVFSRSRYQPAPEGGWAGIVTTVGRKYAAAEYKETRDAGATADEKRASRRTVEFDMNTGNERDDRTQTGRYVRTPEQLASDRSRADAIAILKARHIEFSLDRDHHLTTEQIEQLAAVVKTWDQEG